MDENTQAQPTEMVNPQAETPAPTPQAEPQAETVALSKAEFEKMQKALKEANAEAAKHRKQLQAIEQAEQAKKDADLSELEKIQKKLAQAEAEKTEYATQLARRDLEDKKKTIAAKVGLPEALASRLNGETDEDIEKDAKFLLSTLKPPAPAPAAPRQPHSILPANPGANGSQGETDAQKLARIHGSPTTAFDANRARQRGGGVVYVERSGKE